MSRLVDGLVRLDRLASGPIGSRLGNPRQMLKDYPFTSHVKILMVDGLVRLDRLGSTPIGSSLGTRLRISFYQSC